MQHLYAIVFMAAHAHCDFHHTTSVTMASFAFQLRFRLPLPHVIGHKDYRIKEELYVTMDDLLTRSGLDEIFIQLALKNRDNLRKDVLAQKHGCDPEELDGLDLTADDFMRDRFIEHSLVALRCNIVRFMEKNCPARDLSNQLAGVPLVQWFCHIETFGVIHPPSKSTVDRYSRWIPTHDLNQLIMTLVSKAGLAAIPGVGVGVEAVAGEQVLGLDCELMLTDLWIDNTCLKADIHFPVDWVLLVDATRTLMQNTVLIRSKGELKSRMPQSPEEFIREMNVLAIAMSQARNQPESEKKRKKILRQMKKLVRKIRRHAFKHQELLKQRWEQTPWSEKQAMRIVERIQNVLDQLPTAVKQAHERIIGGRQVPSKEKILSLYEADINVIVRGKLGAATEMGNVLALGEQRDGLIVSWDLYQDNITDSKTSIASVIKAQEVTGNQIKTVCGDRGTSSAANSKQLEAMGVADHLGPRTIASFREKMQDEEFAQGQKRRAQTEGRISILKNQFLGRPLRVKGFENRRQAVSWAVLSHNLWLLARLRIEQEEAHRRQEQERKKAA